MLLAIDSRQYNTHQSQPYPLSTINYLQLNTLKVQLVVGIYLITTN